MARHPDAIPFYAELYAALGEPGCALCTLTNQSAMRYVDNLLWQMVNEPEIREALNAARGYCQNHAWMLNRRGGALGVAILMHDVVKTALTVTDAKRGSPAKSRLTSFLRGGGVEEAEDRQTADELAPQQPCPICAHVQGFEHSLLMTLLDTLGKVGDLDQQYRRSDGICLPHFRQLLTHARPQHDTALLLSAQREVWTRLQAHLAEFIRKRDHRFHGEVITSEEAASWSLALALMSGPNPLDGQESRGLTQSL